MADRLRISVDPGACVGSRLCEMAAPELFRVDPAVGRSEALQPEAEDSDALWDAAEGCPTQAIVVVDAASGEQLFP